MAWNVASSEAKEETNGSDLSRFRIQQAIQSYLDDVEGGIMNLVLGDESDGEIIERTKKDGSCSYCIRVSNGYDRQGRRFW